VEVKIRNPFSLLRRKLLFRFDVWAWFKMAELNGREIHQLDDLNEQQLVLSWIYAAYLRACMERYDRPRYDFNYILKVYRYYYVHDARVIDELKAAIMQSRLMGKSVEEWYTAAEPDDQKKK